MKVIIEGSTQEIADLVLVVQGQLSKIQFETINPQALLKKSNTDNVVIEQKGAQKR